MTIVAQTTSLETTYTYEWLKATIADWLHRSDLTSQIPDFIKLAEGEINTDLRTRLMETDEILTLEAGMRTITLPDNYSEPIRLDLVFTGRDNETLTYLAPNQMPIETYTGAAYQPQYWTVNGENIEFPANADIDYTVLFRMLGDFDIANTDTNSLIAKYPGIYLYGSLLQAQGYMVNDSRIPTWASMYTNLVKKVNRQEARTKALTTLLTDTPSRYGNRANNIFRG